MLQSLKIKNIALINEATVEFNKGLNILTGETGAGKSIIIDALCFVLGDRADKSLIKNGCDSARVEAIFDVDINNPNIIEFFNSIDVEPEETVIINRTLNLSGKNDCRVNGEAVTLNMLKKLTTHLVDIHGQFDHQILMDPKTHIKMLDLFAGEELTKKIEKLSIDISEYKKIISEINSIGGTGEDRQRNIDLLTYQINEIELAELKTGEDEELIIQKNRCLNSEKLSESLNDAVSNLYSGNYNSMMLINSALSDLNAISSIDEKIDNQKERLTNLKYELEDVSLSLRDYLKNVEYSEAELNNIEERLDLIKDLIRKYSKTNDINGVFDFLVDAKEQLNNLLNADEILNKLLVNKNEILSKIYNDCMEITKVRKHFAEILRKNILAELSELGMGKSNFEIAFNSDYNLSNIEDKFTANGADSVEFLFSANAGEPVKSLSKIISGGEMSRFMLAFKCVVSGADTFKTFVFDEIDTGIGGNVGNILGKKLYNISVSNQVFCITHLAQIACFADSHYKVQKYEKDNKTFVDVNPLSIDERYIELDRMIGGGSEYSKLHAIEIINESNNYKKQIEKCHLQ